MAALYDSTNVLITEKVTKVIPSPDMVEIKNRTLDGDYNLTTIGTGATKVEVVALVALAGKLKLDNAKKITAPVKVTGSGKYHIGVIDGEIYTEWLKPDLYRVSLTLLQQSEGEI